MPQADLYFTPDQPMDVKVLAEIERTIAAFDSGAGVCKGRAHPVATHHHSHVFLRVSMLPKAHRDADYAAELGRRLADVIAPRAKAPASVAVNVQFDLTHYTGVTLE